MHLSSNAGTRTTQEKSCAAKTRRSQSEAEIQREIVAHYRLRAAHGVFMFAVPNGGFRRPIDGAILKATGTTPGVPDTIWIKDGRIYAIELKAPNGRVSAAQLATMAEMREAGAIVAVATGLDEALRKLENFGLLRGRATSPVLPMSPRCRRRSPDRSAVS